MKQPVPRRWIKPLHAAGGRTKCSAVEQVVSVAIPTMAFGYSAALDPEQLERALATVLVDYGVVAGRLARREDGLWIEHGFSLPLETVERTETVAELAKALRSKHSSIVCPPLSVRAAVRGEGPLAAVRLTHARDGSVLGIAWNHALGDAASIVQWMRACALAYRGEAYPKPAAVPDRGALLDAKVPIAPRGDQRARVLGWFEFLRAGVYQLWALRGARRVAIDFTWKQIDAIYADASREGQVSPSDALCAHILDTLRRLGVDMSPEITVAVDFRKAFDIPPTVIGNFSDLVFAPVDPRATVAETAAVIRANIDAFSRGELAGTMHHRRLAQLRAAHPNERDLLRFWFFGEPGRGNLRLSNTSRSPYNKVMFGGRSPAFVHVRASDIPLVGTGVLFPSPNAAGLTLDIVLPAGVVEQLASDSSWHLGSELPAPSHA